MSKSGYSGRTINLYERRRPFRTPTHFSPSRKLKRDTYESVTRAKTLGKDIYFNDEDTLYRCAHTVSRFEKN